MKAEHDRLVAFLSAASAVLLLPVPLAALHPVD